MKSLKVLRVDLDSSWPLDRSVPTYDTILSVVPDLVKAAKSLELFELRLDLSLAASWWMFASLSKKTLLRYAHTMTELLEERLRILGSDAKVLVA